MNDTLDRLNERLWVESMPHDYPVDEPERWRIRDDDSAAWASRKLKAAEREVERINAWAEREKARIDQVAMEERLAHQRDIDFFQTHLAVWLKDMIAEGRVKKSVVLPGGKVALRARQPKLNIENEAHLLDYLRGHHPDLLRVREDIDKGKLRKAVKIDGNRVVLSETGEILADVWAEPQEDSISFSPAEDDE